MPRKEGKKQKNETREKKGKKRRDDASQEDMEKEENKRIEKGNQRKSKIQMIQKN